MDREKRLEFDIEPLDISELIEHSSENDEDDEDNNELRENKHQRIIVVDDDENEIVYDSDQISRKLEPSSGDDSSSSVSQPPSLHDISVHTSEKHIFIKLKLPNGKICTEAVNSTMTVGELKILLCNKFQVTDDVIDIWENVGSLKLLNSNEKALNSLCLNKNNLEIYISVKDPEIELNEVIDEEVLAKFVDIITVSIDEPYQTSPRLIVVEIENQSNKLFLGGFRCKKTNKEYYHAETQTIDIFNKKKCKLMKRSRTCQTITDTPQQTLVNKEIQTEDEELHVLEPIKAVSGSDVTHRRPSFIDVSNKIITIQKVWRGWAARQTVDKIKQDIHTEQALQDIFTSHKKKGYNPVVFEVLYQLVEKWRKRCLEHAYATKTEGPTRADFQDILEMQVHLLRIIEKERIKMREKLKKEKEQKLLEECCSPMTWKGYKGLKISMETVHSQRAAELKKLYDILGETKHLSNVARKENLTTVQAALKNYRSDQCKEILTLINRELQLLDMGFGHKQIESLHKRIEKLFINLIKEPEEEKINSQMRSTKNRKQEEFYLCNQCKKMLPPTSFIVPLRDPKIKLCVSCNWIDNISHKRIDYQPYQIILRDLRADEVKKGCYRSLAFLMDAHDVHYLIDQIWHCQSAISHSTEISALRLGRWNSQQEWSPWNTIVLNKSELQDHCEITQLDKIYGEQFIKNIKVKLLMARMHFKTLYNFASAPD